MQTLTLRRPDDFHLHLRDGLEMADIIRDSARQFARAIIMPNLKPPVVTTTDALAYRKRILENLPDKSTFIPLMTLYLTDKTSPDEITRAKQSGNIYGVKYYPAGVTTNAEDGVTSIENIYPVLEAMIEQDLPLLVHGEVINEDIDIFDREAVFIDRILLPVIEKFQGLRVIFEHITTQESVEFVKSGPQTLAATITPHHLLLTRDAFMSKNSMNPYYYCLPVLKDEKHRQAIIEIAISGHPRFFLGTDSAPHSMKQKESIHSCAGIYTAHAAIELYAEIFEAAGQLDRLEAFSSQFGADFYGLPYNEQSITLEKQEWIVPETMPFGKERLVPFRAGEKCKWKLR